MRDLNKPLDFLDTIETKHLKLRCPTKDDTAILSNLWRNENVREFLGGIVSENIVREKIDALHHHWNQYYFGQWVVCKKDNKQILGICGLHHSDEGIEISYMFFPEYWGKGFAKEAALATINYGFNIVKLDRIIAITQEANYRSRRLLENMGMKHINTFLRFNAIQSEYELRYFDKLKP